MNKRDFLKTSALGFCALAAGGCTELEKYAEETEAVVQAAGTAPNENNILRIQPVEYSGKRLEEVGRKVVAALSPLIQRVTILPAIGMETIPGYDLQNAGPGYLSFPFSSQYAELVGPEFLCHIAALSKNGERLAVVTSLPSVRERNGTWCHGQASPVLRDIYVSVYRPEFAVLDTDDHVYALSVAAVHELLHTYGLQHHFNGERTIDGKRCPLEEDLAQNAWNGAVSWKSYIESKSYMPCNECCRKLGIPMQHPAV